jgi:transcriptional regulator GlxA family with amidase domain
VLDRREFLIGAAGLGLVVALGGSGVYERRGVSAQTIAVVVWDGVEELDLAGPYEVLTAWAAAAGRGDRVLTVADRPGELRCAHGLRLLPDTTWADLDAVDVLVLPGGNSSVQLADERFLARLRSLADGGTLMTSVCTGALPLAAAGLLDNRPATTHWGSIDSLRSYGNGIDVRPDERFVDAGPVITSAGVSAGIDMALHLVARLDSVERARQVRRYIQYDPEPPV